MRWQSSTDSEFLTSRSWGVVAVLAIQEYATGLTSYGVMNRIPFIGQFKSEQSLGGLRLVGGGVRVKFTYTTFKSACMGEEMKSSKLTLNSRGWSHSIEGCIVGKAKRWRIYFMFPGGLGN